MSRFTCSNSQCWAWTSEISFTRPTFFSFSLYKSGNYWPVKKLRGCTETKITAHDPGQHMPASQCPEPNSKCSNSVEVECSFLRLKLCQRRRRDRHWRNSRKTNYKELSNTKARVSVHWRAKSHAEWPRGGKEFQHPARIKPVSLYGTRLTATRVNH